MRTISLVRSFVTYRSTSSKFHFVPAAGIHSSSLRMASKNLATHSPTAVILGRDTNQALGIGEYAIDFIKGGLGGEVDPWVYERVKKFHTDSVMCGISAVACKTQAPTILREEALEYPAGKSGGASVFGNSTPCAPEKAVLANASAVREWDSNGTVFGYNTDPSLKGHKAGEFGHNDFYPVVMAAAQVTGKINGRMAMKAMLCLDEIRGRLAEVFSLKTYKIDHVVHGAIASAAVYGALLGATADQIESAIGMVVAHYIPWRAIRAGKQLSDSKGASAAISTEVAIMSMKRAMRGFAGPKDIFRNPESIFRYFEPQSDGQSPFSLILSTGGKDFAISGMHFKLGVYEHQSAGALESFYRMFASGELIKKVGDIKSVTITAYEPAYGIIGDPAKRDPRTRQSADHSMVYIVGTLLRKAMKYGEKNPVPSSLDQAWCDLMLTPRDYARDAIYDDVTRSIMEKISFRHGGKAFDDHYPDGIPSQVEVTLNDNTKLDSGFVMYPSGHARNTTADLNKVLDSKFAMMGSLGLSPNDIQPLISKLDKLESMSESEVSSLYGGVTVAEGVVYEE